ncbi:MAG: hypothetical protein IJL93_01430 [Bacteroidales bacterium]|nr:hypothetical protein [Bacteroidales bacterium]
MKKYLIILAAALAALVSCGENGLVPEKETLQSSPIRFQLTARHPDSRPGPRPVA